MSSNTQWTCDRCKKEGGRNDVPGAIAMSRELHDVTYPHLDLCEKCMHLFVNFVHEMMRPEPKHKAPEGKEAPKGESRTA